MAVPTGRHSGSVAICMDLNERHEGPDGGHSRIICPPGLDDLDDNRENEKCEQAFLRAAFAHRTRSAIGKLH